MKEQAIQLFNKTCGLYDQLKAAKKIRTHMRDFKKLEPHFYLSQQDIKREDAFNRSVLGVIDQEKRLELLQMVTDREIRRYRQMGYRVEVDLSVQPEGLQVQMQLK